MTGSGEHVFLAGVNMKKIEPIVRKAALTEDEDRENLRYWLGRPPEERIEAMRCLREQHFTLQGHKVPPRIKKIATKRP